jgi:hypothetical protein
MAGTSSAAERLQATQIRTLKKSDRTPVFKLWRSEYFCKRGPAKFQHKLHAVVYSDLQNITFNFPLVVNPLIDYGVLSNVCSWTNHTLRILPTENSVQITPKISWGYVGPTYKRSGRNSVGDIATWYGLNGPVIENQWRQDCPSRLARGQPVFCRIGNRSCVGVKEAGRGADHSFSSSAEVANELEIYPPSSLGACIDMPWGDLYLHPETRW